MRHFIICGIGTDVGKTIASCHLAVALGYDYWKPIECGESDTEKVRTLIGPIGIHCHKPIYQLKAPLSPYQASCKEKITLDPLKIILPSTQNGLIIESCGGLMVPFTRNELISDIFSKWDCAWILVIRSYLGCINHSLLTHAWMKTERYKIAGVILNGSFDPMIKEYLLAQTGLSCLGELPADCPLTSSDIQRRSSSWNAQLHALI